MYKESFLVLCRSIVSFNIILACELTCNGAVQSRGAPAISPSLITELYRLNYGLDHFLPHKDVLAHVAKSILANNRNIPNEVVGNVTKLVKTVQEEQDMEQLMKVTGESIKSNILNVKYSHTDRGSPVNKAFIKYYSQNANNDYGMKIGNVSPSRFIGDLNSRQNNSTGGLISRASWIYYVDGERCSGEVDDLLHRAFNSLVLEQHQRVRTRIAKSEGQTGSSIATKTKDTLNIMKEDCLSTEFVEVLVR